MIEVLQGRCGCSFLLFWILFDGFRVKFNLILYEAGFFSFAIHEYFNENPPFLLIAGILSCFCVQAGAKKGKDYRN